LDIFVKCSIDRYCQKFSHANAIWCYPIFAGRETDDRVFAKPEKRVFSYYSCCLPSAYVCGAAGSIKSQIFNILQIFVTPTFSAVYSATSANPKLSPPQSVKRVASSEKWRTRPMQTRAIRANATGYNVCIIKHKVHIQERNRDETFKT